MSCISRSGREFSTNRGGKNGKSTFFQRDRDGSVRGKVRCKNCEYMKLDTEYGASARCTARSEKGRFITWQGSIARHDEYSIQKVKKNLEKDVMEPNWCPYREQREAELRKLRDAYLAFNEDGDFIFVRKTEDGKTKTYGPYSFAEAMRICWCIHDDFMR